MIDFAECMRDLVDVHFPEAEKIVLHYPTQFNIEGDYT
jgi:hypothetical protein